MGSGYTTGDIQVACYIELEDTFEHVKSTIENGQGSTYYTNLKTQINKWLQTEILNNGNVTLTKPKPCVIKFNDVQLILYKYSLATIGSQYLHTYTFTTIEDAGDSKNIYKFEIQLATSKNALSIVFADYSINRIDATITELGAGGLSIIEISGTSTSGTLSSEQMKIANNNEPSCIKFNNEYYYKNDEAHTPDTYVYTHNGHAETGAIIKYITVTVSTAAWVLTVQNIGGGKYSKHLHYDIHLEGSWDTSNQIMTLDTTSQNAIKVVLDKLDELTTGNNYDFLVNMRVAGKASAEGDIVVIGANMKLNYIPGSEAGVYRNLQAQFILSGNASDTANIVISDTEFTSNSQMFYLFMSGVYTVFQFDINY